MADTRNSKTFFATKEEARKNQQWYLVDATGKTLGRFASEIAKILRGKHRVDFTPHVDCGDGVVVMNADKIFVTGSKEARKVYRHYTGYIGGLKEVSYRTLMQTKPERILEHAIRKMMPRTKLTRAQLKRLRVIVGEKHEIEAQKPIKIDL